MTTKSEQPRSGSGGDYKSTRSTRFYPGASLSAERRRKILEFEVELDDATYEDILFSTASAYTGTFYAVIALIEERWGKEAAHELVRQLGYVNCRRNMERWLRRHGQTTGSALLMSKYQDWAHGMRGPDHANAISEYDAEHARVYRTKCGWHTGRPEGAESYCRYFSEKGLDGYREADTNLKRAEIVRCMSFGDDDCEHLFWYVDSEPTPGARHNTPGGGGK